MNINRFLLFCVLTSGVAAYTPVMAEEGLNSATKAGVAAGMLTSFSMSNPLAALITTIAYKWLGEELLLKIPNLSQPFKEKLVKCTRRALWYNSLNTLAKWLHSYKVEMELKKNDIKIDNLSSGLRAIGSYFVVDLAGEYLIDRVRSTLEKKIGSDYLPDSEKWTLASTILWLMRISTQSRIVEKIASKI